VFIESLAKGLSVLEAFQPDAPTLTLSELARRTGMSMGSAQRITHTLVTLGYLDKDPHTRAYRVGPRVLRLARSYMQSVDLQRASQLPMQQLAREVGETVNVSVRSGMDIVYVLRIPGQDSIVLPNLWVGSNLPLHFTSMGRAMVAFLADDERESIVRRIAFPFATNAREVSEADFLDDLERIRERGYAVNDRDLRPDLRSLAAPVFNHEGHAVAALGVAVSAQRYDLATLQDRLVDPLTRAAASVSHNLGFDTASDGRRRRPTAST
jgi:IclR family transcriptional regulator, pca regulon regulatory protein